MKLRHLGSLLLALTLATALPAVVSAQSINKHAVKEQLLHKTLLFRGHYVCPTPQPCSFVFNRQGQIQSKAAVAPFSLGVVYIDRVKFKRNRLELRAQPATILRLSRTGTPRFRTLILNPKAKLQIRIDFDASQPAGLQKTLHAVFAGTIKEALKAAPPKKRKLDLNSLPLLTPTTRKEADPELAEVGWPPQQTVTRLFGANVSSPKPIHMVRPKYTEKAKSNKVQGNCKVYVVVNTHGFAQNIRVLKSLPDGLDEQTIIAISQLRLKPAMENGKPIPVRMILSESYRLH